VEAEARLYTKGNWLPNHFVPVVLLPPDATTQSNNQTSSAALSQMNVSLFLHLRTSAA